MAIYLIKSGLCLALVLGTYHLLFEDKKMHQFNRWFLLFGLAFSFLVPLMETSFSIDFFHLLNSSELTTNNIGLATEGVSLASGEANQIVTTSSERSQFPVFLTIAFLISSLMLIRFCYNITTLFRKAFSNEQIDCQGAKLVLLKEKVLPHTFGKYIFINESDYRNGKIEAELFTHELTHAREWHSLDIVLIEALQVVFWINPLLYFYKRAIQLNHEFLADDQVVKSTERVRDYQELLLEKASCANVYLASNINFAVTKKRLTMMTKNTSRSITTLFAFAALPLFACLLVLFSCGKTNKLEADEANQLTAIERIPDTSSIPAYESLPVIDISHLLDEDEESLIKFFIDQVENGTTTFHLENGIEIAGEKVLEIIIKKSDTGGFSFSPRLGKKSNVEIYFQGLEGRVDLGL